MLGGLKVGKGGEWLCSGRAVRALSSSSTIPVISDIIYIYIDDISSDLYDWKLANLTCPIHISPKASIVPYLTLPVSHNSMQDFGFTHFSAFCQPQSMVFPLLPG